MKNKLPKNIKQFVEGGKKTRFKKEHTPWNLGNGDYMKGEKNSFFGKHHNKKTKLKISDSKKGQKINYPKNRKGHITTQKTKEKIGKANKGKNNAMWLGGKSFEEYGAGFNRQLKNIVKERDNFKCQLCFKKGRVVHHIDYNKKNNLIINLILLCSSCHSKTNFNRKEWTKLFKRKFK